MFHFGRGEPGAEFFQRIQRSLRVEASMRDAVRNVMRVAPRPSPGMPAAPL